MPAVCRPARPQDLEQADALVVRSINDLTQRHGFEPMAVQRPPRFQLFSLENDPDGLWVAEDSGQILGFAFSWVCGDLWFLAQLFVAPGQQGGGIGNELLKRALNHAQKAGATNKALITFAFNRASQGLYIRHGLFPRLPLYFFLFHAPPCGDGCKALDSAVHLSRTVLRTYTPLPRLMLGPWGYHARSIIGF